MGEHTKQRCSKVLSSPWPTFILVVATPLPNVERYSTAQQPSRTIVMVVLCIYKYI